MAGLQTDDVFLGALAESKHDQFEHEKYSPPSLPSLPDNNKPPHIHPDHTDPADPHYGDEFPTVEERDTLRRVPDSVPWTSYLIAYVELAERFSYYGSTVVFTNFIQEPLPKGSHTGAGGADGQSGALGLGQRASTGLTTFNSFWVYVMPLLGAYIADTYWGRYKTICVAVAIALFGHVLLIISAVPGVIEKSNSALGVFVIAVIIMGVGTGAFKSNISPLIAEQYRKTKLTVRQKGGERVIVDPTLTASRIYMVRFFISVL